MKLGTLKEGGRDGTLVVVSQDLKTAVRVPEIAPTLQAALDDWAELEPELRSIYRLLNHGRQPAAFDLDPGAMAAPLPRARLVLMVLLRFGGQCDPFLCRQ